MPPRSKPFTEADAARRDQILALADARGVTRKRLAEVAGEPDNAGEQRMVRWSRGEAHWTEEQLAKMEAFLESRGAVAAALGAEATPEAVAEALDAARELAGEPDPDEKDALRALAKKFRPAAVGKLAQLMVSAKSENTQLRAAELLLERSDGKPIQSVVDLTPKPPDTAEGLASAVQKAIDDHKKRSADENAKAPASR